MKSVSCSTYIFVFFEYSNSMWGLPARSVRRTRTRRQAPFGVQGGAPTMRMRDKVALVTGAGSGIGRATALRLAAEGARVACADSNQDAAAETATRIADAGGDALALVADVTDDGACARMVEAALARFGRLTTLVNSAGVRAERRDPTPPPDEWQRGGGVHLTGTYLASRAALAARASSGSGSITNLASIFGLVGGSLSPAYAASKGGVVNLTRTMALTWAPKVRVNCVCPGVIETPMTAPLLADAGWRESAVRRHPLGRVGQPEEIAAAILYLASDEAAFVTGRALPRRARLPAASTPPPLTPARGAPP